MVVSNTSPLNYLILIEEIDLLPRFYERVVIPQSVCEELQAAETPEAVRTWILNPPDWLEISSETGSLDSDLASLHAGERDAISLALHLQADAVLIDERRGRGEAEERELKVIGTIGVLAFAHESGLLNLSNAIGRLQQTTFHLSPKLVASVLQKYKNTPE
jgi:predicted nucleic acid-binding protein